MSQNMHSPKAFRKLRQHIAELDARDKSHFFIISLVMFSLLFSYPLVRSTTTVFFLESAGAAKSPLVWIFSVLALSVMVSLKNIAQTKVSLHAIFHGVVILTLSIMFGSLYFYTQGFSQAAYILYVTKEVYIVLCVHMILGYLNSSLTTEQAKLFYGPLGAIGSLGGILGGLSTSFLASRIDNTTLLILGLSFLIFSSWAFSLTDKKYNIHLNKPSRTPLRSLGAVKGYVALIIGVIVISQFCINIANLKFNLLFEQLVVGAQEKTAYLGGLYSLINTVSLVTQFFLIPFFFHRFKLNQIHLSLPVVFGLSTIMMLTGSGAALSLVAGGFMVMKAMDYSLLAAAKELLYFPLSVEQKYGAKYLADMVFYRLAKGLISAVLLFFQSHLAINILLGLSLVTWGVLSFALGRAWAQFKENS